KQDAILYCGMDLLVKENFLYVIDHRGRRVLVKRVPTHARSFKESLGPLVRRRLKVVLEASTMTKWAVGQLRALRVQPCSGTHRPKSWCAGETGKVQCIKEPYGEGVAT
ncbi:MAG: hypothetical protein ACE5I0_03240, partial [Candidatus Binatia bacterium]